MCSLPIVPPATDTHRAQSKNKPVEIFSLYNQHCVFTTKHPSPAIRPPPQHSLSSHSLGARTCLPSTKLLVSIKKKCAIVVEEGANSGAGYTGVH